MELIDYLKSLDGDDALESFALRVGTTLGHLRNVAYGQRVASAALAAQIEIESKGLVQKSALRPDDWHRIWDPRLLHQMIDVPALEPGAHSQRRDTH
jgi:hypothetical protein